MTSVKGRGYISASMSQSGCGRGLGDTWVGSSQTLRGHLNNAVVMVSGGTTAQKAQPSAADGRRLFSGPGLLLSSRFALLDPNISDL